MKRAVEALLNVDQPPRRTAAAFAVGVFISFSPFLGFQIIAAISVAFLLKLNRVAVLAGLCSNLPWFVVPWYAATTMLAAAVLGVRIPQDLSAEFGRVFQLSLLEQEFWVRTFALVSPFLSAFLIGPTLGAAVLAIGSYTGGLALISRHRARTQQPVVGEPVSPL